MTGPVKARVVHRVCEKCEWYDGVARVGATLSEPLSPFLVDPEPLQIKTEKFVSMWRCSLSSNNRTWQGKSGVLELQDAPPIDCPFHVEHLMLVSE